MIGQLWQTPAPGSLLMTNGWSSMGFGIPSAIAASLCLRDRPVACVVGDGGFLMMVGEMATAKRLGVSVVFVLLTDHSLELIRIKQERKSCEIYGTSLHGDDYDSALTFFGVPVLPAHDAASYRSALEKAFAAGGPVIVEAIVDPREYGELVLMGDRLASPWIGKGDWYNYAGEMGGTAKSESRGKTLVAQHASRSWWRGFSEWHRSRGWE